MAGVLAPFHVAMKMRNTSRSLLFLGLCAAALVSCATAPPQTTAPAPAREIPASQLVDRAGDSVETAVLVPAGAPNEGIDFENEFMFDRFGRFRRNGGGTGQLNGRRFEVVDIELPDGSTRKVFFDITENWKAWQRPGSK